MLPVGRSGYIQAVQPEPLVRAAADQDVVVRLARQVGDHVVEGTPLAWARLPERSPSASNWSERRWTTPWSSGSSRPWSRTSPSGCVGSSTSATRPVAGNQRPLHGIQAVQHLSVLLCMLAGRRLGDRLYHDEQETLRVAVPLPQFADYLRLSTAQIRRSGAKEPAVARSLIQLLKDVGGER